MGKRGPAPAPTNVRLLRGDDKYRINQSEALPPADKLNMPATLSPGAKSVWKRLAPSLTKAGLLTPWDRDAFAVYCEAVVIHRQACKNMQDGILVKTQAGFVKNPSWQLVRDSAQVIKQYAGEFGLTPSARSSISMPQADEDELARILS